MPILHGAKIRPCHRRESPPYAYFIIDIRYETAFISSSVIFFAIMYMMFSGLLLRAPDLKSVSALIK